MYVNKHAHTHFYIYTCVYISLPSFFFLGGGLKQLVLGTRNHKAPFHFQSVSFLFLFIC